MASLDGAINLGEKTRAILLAFQSVSSLARIVWVLTCKLAGFYLFMNPCVCKSSLDYGFQSCGFPLYLTVWEQWNRKDQLSRHLTLSMCGLVVRYGLCIWCSKYNMTGKIWNSSCISAVRFKPRVSVKKLIQLPFLISFLSTWSHPK